MIYKLTDFYKANVQSENIYESFSISKEKGEEFQKVLDEIEIREEVLEDIYATYESIGLIDSTIINDELVQFMDERVEINGLHELAYISFLIGKMAEKLISESLDTIRITKGSF